MKSHRYSVSVLHIFFFFATACISHAQDPQPEPVGAEPLHSHVKIETNLTHILLNDEHRQGVDWEAILSDYQRVPLSRQNSAANAQPAFNISVGSLSVEDYAVLLDALDTVGRVNDLGKNEVRCPNPGEAVFDMQSMANDMALQAQFKLAAKSDTGAGQKLFVDLTLSMNQLEGGQSVLVPYQMHAEIPFKDKNIIALGGFHHEREIKRTYKFPLLGDLPILDLVFRQKGKWIEKSELIFFLNPSLITDEMPVPAVEIINEKVPENS